MISAHFQGKPFNITVIQVYAPMSNTEETEAEWFYEDLKDLLELTPKNDVLLIIGDWDARGESQEIPRIIGKFGLRAQNKTGQRLTEFCQQITLVIADTLFQQHKRHGHHHMVNTEVRLIIFSAAKDGKSLYSQQKQEWVLTVAQIMNYLLPNLDLI